MIHADTVIMYSPKSQIAAGVLVEFFNRPERGYVDPLVSLPGWTQAVVSNA